MEIKINGDSIECTQGDLSYKHTCKIGAFLKDKESYLLARGLNVMLRDKLDDRAFGVKVRQIVTTPDLRLQTEAGALRMKAGNHIRGNTCVNDIFEAVGLLGGIMTKTETGYSIAF